MADKKYVEVTLKLEDDKAESLKSQLRAGGCGHMSATQAAYKAIEFYGSTAKSVRLDEPERKEIESRAGTTTPLRNSKDILRAFEKLAGGPDAITVDLDPSLADPMRDVGHGLGYGLSEFAKIILEDSFASNHLYTCELRPLFFSAAEWKHLLFCLHANRIRSAAELLSILRLVLPDEEPVRQSTVTLAPAE
jgi:hypothetical protein